MITQNVGPFVTNKKIMKSAGEALIPTAAQYPQGSKDSPAPQVLAAAGVKAGDAQPSHSCDSLKVLCPALLGQCSQELRSFWSKPGAPCGSCPTEPTLVLCSGNSGPLTDGGVTVLLVNSLRANHCLCFYCQMLLRA